MRHKSISLAHIAFLSSTVTFLSIFSTSIEAVTIDNQVTVIKNDCFERQAIGYRLKPSDVYKTLDIKTVPECQRECTKEEDTCKTFSFGIGAKGNSSCELSKRVIRETADLKPIGTLLDEDFDLYIKKLGCKLVIEQKPTDIQPQSDEIPTGTLGTESFGLDSFKPKPQFDSPGGSSGDNGYGYGSHGQPTRKPHGTLQTTLISVRPDPSRPGYTGLSAALTASGYDRPEGPQRPVNEPLNERPFYGESGRPRPKPDPYGASISNSYVNEIPGRPSYGGSERPGGLYVGQSSYGAYDGSGGDYYRPSRPYKPYKPPNHLDNEIYYNRPGINRPNFRPGVGYYRPIDPMMDEFKPHFDNLRPEAWDGYQRPDPMRDPIASYEYGMTMGSFESYGPGSDSRPSYEARPEYDRPERPQRPSGYYRPSYDDRDRPSRPSMGYGPSEMEFSRPGRPQYEYGNGYRPEVPQDFRPDVRPTRPVYEERPFDRPPGRPSPDGGYGQRPSDFRPPPEYTDERPGTRPSSGRPESPRPDFDRPPSYEGPSHTQFRPNWDKDTINRPYDSNNPNVNYENIIKPVTEDADYGNRRQDNFGPQRNNTKYDPNQGPIVSQSLGPNGEKITSIITEIQVKPACFRRALAGKRVTRSLVRRALSCGRVEDCQQECQDEKRFVCEGFNYRLDPTGRGNGDCELLDLPMVRMDMIRDIYPDPDYDVYEKDRNGYPDCKGGGFGFGFGERDHHDRDRDRDRDYNRNPNPYADRRHDSLYDRDRPEPRPVLPPPRPLDYPRYPDRHQDDRYDDRRRPGGYLPVPDSHRRVDEHRDRDGSPYGGGGGGPGDYRNHNNYDFNNHRDSSSYLPDRDRQPAHDRNHWGLAGSNSWGSYGNGHTTGIGNGIPSPYDTPAGDTYAPKPGYDMLPKQPSYLPAGGYGQDANSGSGSVYGNAYGGSYGGVTYGSTRPTFGIVIPINSNNFGQPKPTGYGPTSGSGYGTSGSGSGTTGYDYPNVPITETHFPNTNGDALEHKDSDAKHIGYNFLKEECSLRTATGFRLHKIIVKKYYSVPDIYECETLCFKEKDFQCQSYAYRYTMTSSVPTDNCYLSERNYKQLDFYTDLEPDRDFDIYTMNNRKKCEEQIPLEKEHSDCFWHTRSGQRLDQKVVREATMVKSIVECQLACLRATLFLCRGFSFRYGSPVIGGPVENCLLTDWPFKEIDPNTQFASELGFEIYERGSFGHGCEPNHFAVRGKDEPIVGAKTDQLCYVGYGTPARLQPSAIRKSMTVTSELDCKTECTKFRHSSLFQCMSFSYKTKAQRGEPNCDLSDILQRDLLNDVDYIPDKDSWLFSWDHYNPECVSISNTQYPQERPSGGQGGQSGYGGGGHYIPNHGTSGYGSGHGHGHSHSVAPSGGRHDYGLVPLRPHPHDGPHGVHAHENGHGRDDLDDIRRYEGPITALDTWRVYSVSGWPCRRGSVCRENKEAGFWYCDLEGGDRGTWDYCCRPDHQCGYSEGYNYQWCYVGPDRTQWRKCSERYYPYSPQRRPNGPGGGGNRGGQKPYLPSYNPNYDPPPAYADGFLPSNGPRPPPFRPNRPLQRPRIPPNMPSLNEYESEFNRQFLDSPKPGGFGEPRYWPVSYLHKELPPEAGNKTEFTYDRMKDGRLTAIHNLITIIKSNSLKDIKYEINNDTNLLIQVPLPGNFTQDKKLNSTSANRTKNSNKSKNKNKANLEDTTSLENNTKSARIEAPGDQIDAASEDGSKTNKSVNTRDIQRQKDEPPSFYSSATSGLGLASNRTGRTRQLSIQDITRHISTQAVRASPSKAAHEELPSLSVPTYKKSYIVRTNKTDRALNISF